MAELHFAWLELAILTPLVGVLFVARVRDPSLAWKRSLLVTGITLLLTLCCWVDFETSGSSVVRDPGNVVAWLFGETAVVIDEISAPLLPLASLLYLVVTLATLRTKVRRFPFAWSLVSQSLLLALLSCRAPWGVVGLSVAQIIPPRMELWMRGRSSRVFTLHMGVFAFCLVAGRTLIDFRGAEVAPSALAISLFAAAVLIRSGAVPVHCWMTDLFEKAGLGTALLFVTPMSGAYIAVRLLLPIAPEWALRGIAILSLVTAVYAACMALVQRDVRRFFSYLFLSNASLVLVGLEVASPTSMTGGLALWLSAGISLAGLGLTLRAVESRCGRLSHTDYHGLYEHMPSLAVFYLLTALASIGFPGTIGFVGAELLVESVVNLAPLVGMIVVLTGALNGIAVMRVYFRLFTGTHHTSSVSLEVRGPEKAAVLAMSLLIIGGGMLPQPGISSRYRAATEILSRRQTAAPIDGTSTNQDLVDVANSAVHHSSPQ
jgi:NADH-quinone oxidoreductase subunit M